MVGEKKGESEEQVAGGVCLGLRDRKMGVEAEEEGGRHQDGGGGEGLS